MPQLGFELEADEIIPNLWQGSFPRLLSAAECGFEVVVLCAQERLMGDSNQEYEAHGMKVIEAPFEDSRWPTDVEISTARWATVKVVAAHNNGKKVLVTCHAGLNRSGLVSAMAVREIQKIPGAEAVKLVQSKRENALINPTFAMYVYNLK